MVPPTSGAAIGGREESIRVGGEAAIGDAQAAELGLTRVPLGYWTQAQSGLTGSPRFPRMKILILSRNAQLYSTSALLTAAEKRGHEVRVLDYLRCHMSITARKP